MLRLLFESSLPHFVRPLYVASWIEMSKADIYIFRNFMEILKNSTDSLPFLGCNRRFSKRTLASSRKHFCRVLRKLSSSVVDSLPERTTNRSSASKFMPHSPIQRKNSLFPGFVEFIFIKWWRHEIISGSLLRVRLLNGLVAPRSPVYLLF